MLVHKRIIAACLTAALLLPGANCANDAALERKVPVVSAEDASSAERTSVSCEIGDTIASTEGLSITFSGYDTGSRFRYYPAGGFSSASLVARGGYRLLCLYIEVDNGTGRDVMTSELLSMELRYGKSYTSQPQNTFFYRTKTGAFAGGARAIRSGAAVEGCLLFALPIEAEKSEDRIDVTWQAEGDTFECILRTGKKGLRVVDEEEVPV